MYLTALSSKLIRALFYQFGVAEHLDRRRNVAVNGNLLLRGRLADRNRRTYRLRALALTRNQLDFQLLRLQTRQVEQIAEQVRQAVGVILNDAGEATRRLPVVNRAIR